VPGDGFSPSLAERRCRHMLTTLKITRIWIEQIEKIEAEDFNAHEEFEFAQRSLTIWTTEGEKYELILQADTPDRLEFKKPPDWLTPQLYKGRGEEK
jgi:hypothetical protein